MEYSEWDLGYPVLSQKNVDLKTNSKNALKTILSLKR